MPDYVYLNGEIVEAREARVSAFDAGFSHAAGLFETMRAYHGRVMRLADHLDRLFASAAKLEMQISIAREAMEDAVGDVLAANVLREARIRLVVTPGEVPRPGQSDSPGPRPTLLVTAEAVRPYPRDLYQNGMRVCLCPYRQNRQDPLAGHKTLAYLPRLMAMREAAARRCNESLWFTTDHHLAEGSVCNVFIASGGTLRTPPLDTPILPGTVRRAVIELAGEAGIPCEEGAIDVDALLAAGEVFLTGSVLEVMPVTAIEKHTVGDGLPGPLTKRLQQLYQDLVQRECQR
jgi:branched-chain amino acid aminotransferase